MNTQIFIILALAAVCGTALGYLLAASGRRALERELAATQARIAELEATGAARERERVALQAQVTELTGEKARLAENLRGLEAAQRAELAARDRQLTEQKTWIEEKGKLFEQNIENTANRLLEDKAKRFTEINRKEIDAIVGPFKEQLSDFRQRVDHIYQQDSQDRSQLKEQIVGLTQLNQTVSQQALDLTRALTISTKATGNWGETILRKILEDSGLREGHEYKLQHRIVADDGGDQQPDAVIFLPEQRQVVVDAKVSNKAWKLYCSEQDESLRAQHLEDHLLSLRAHIRGLAERDYTQSPDLTTVDFVLMFVPVEAALLEAIARDESLYTEAYRRKVILVVPTTLMAVIKLIEGIWSVQRRQQNADEIAEAGRKLYEKLTHFAESFEAVGRAIGNVQTSFEQARGQLATGKGNAIRLAERMRGLGVSPTKNKLLPAGLVQLAEEGDDAAPAADDVAE